jgi:hypothetical protein
MRLGDRVIRVSTTAAVLVVAAVAAWCSYWHAVAVIEVYGAESWLTARLVPLTLDGLVGASSLLLLHCARYRLSVPRLARWALGLGIAATVAMNGLHGLSRGPLAAVLAAWPALALVISYELVMWIVRSGRELADNPNNTGATSSNEPRSPTSPLDDSHKVHSSEPYSPQGPRERTEPSPALSSASLIVRRARYKENAGTFDNGEHVQRTPNSDTPGRGSER